MLQKYEIIQKRHRIRIKNEEIKAEIEETKCFFDEFVTDN
jgi:hypothetical protein